ncbi:MAG: lysine exporter LysO family protein [Firmicutes bacterium]|nr:lysine exporter LysO family protein [Bacillota bacterium]MDY5856510.1 lysine exporter LysO family protein [Anaerovoracaceae bacterium]
MNVYVPFLCLALGAAINWKGLPQPVLIWFDRLMNLALVVLMAVIGINIGTSEEVMGNLGRIGAGCLLISLAAIWCSVGLVVLCERTVMPLEKIRLQMAAESAGTMQSVGSAETADDENSGFSPLVLVMPGFILAGILVGWLFLDGQKAAWMDTALTVSLVFLYTGVGVSLASNKSVFGYIRKLGLRILFLPLAIFLGCMLGGFLAGLVLGVPTAWVVTSASGMGYYSLTGAFMTETWGIEAGTYGFIVNVSRDVFTVLLLPVLIRISKGSPIASGAAGCMDTMLVPVSRYVGPELSLVALISGTILTFVVPVWLPAAAGLFASFV